MIEFFQLFDISPLDIIIIFYIDKNVDLKSFISESILFMDILLFILITYLQINRKHSC